METALEKARREPESMKGRILRGARRVFGTYGYHGTTTRMIAQEVGIDISTLYYHWGEKGELYEGVIQDIYADLREKLIEVEGMIHGRPLVERLEVAIEVMTDYLFLHPEISNLVLLRYFSRTRHNAKHDFHVPEVIGDIARSMELCADKKKVTTEARMQVLAMMNAIHNFISGENFFRPLLHLEEEEYRTRVKETLKFILIPPFARQEEAGIAEARSRVVFEDD